MNDDALAAERADRVLQLEGGLAVRAEIERAHAAARAGDSSENWRRLQEENVRLRAERERLQQEVASLRTRARHHSLGGGESGSGSEGVLESLLALFKRSRD